MLITVNDELIDVVQKEEKTKNNSSVVQFRSAMDLFVGKEGNDRKYGKQPIITATLAREDDWTGECRLHYAKSNKGALPRVTCRVTDKPDTDLNYPVYVVAVPFNGILDAIKPSNEYRIHRGFIGKAKKKEIAYKGETYKKVAFMVVTPNNRMLKKSKTSDNTSSIDLEVISYNLNSTSSGEVKTTRSTATISFTTDGADFSIVTEDWKDVNPEELDSAKRYIFPIYTGPKEIKNKAYSSNTITSSKKQFKPLTQKFQVPKLDDMIDKSNKELSEKQACLKRRVEK